MSTEQDADALIRDAVRQEEESIDAFLGDRPLTEDLLQSFRGRRRWMTIFPMLLSLLYLALGVWCGYEFFQEPTTKIQIAWATGLLCCAMSICTTKVWIWGEWRRNSVIREVKRLELKIDKLAR
ncbi:hypothetical protein KOR34_49670 [Posidoniimonas corsicana]|uniref:Uncharacterized protein n=1 Tax=Posidoniimonas corsicana TaxID=1938618 RepID=A0A5C5UW56_9BACT|nr:DUF6768 family protein [Posidoniimonas corsicana]TWT30408.1 hypothetical protein KOR34_49670 [Posidoniimonas corsicana]